jgi:hypothetical protein
MSNFKNPALELASRRHAGRKAPSQNVPWVECEQVSMTLEPWSGSWSGPWSELGWCWCLRWSFAQEPAVRSRVLDAAGLAPGGVIWFIRFDGPGST